MASIPVHCQVKAVADKLPAVAESALRSIAAMYAYAAQGKKERLDSEMGHIQDMLQKDLSGPEKDKGLHSLLKLNARFGTSSRHVKL